MKVVHVTMKLDVPPTEYRSAAEAMAALLARTEGVGAPLLLFNPDAGIAAGVCLFPDEVERDDFLAGPVVAVLRGSHLHRRLEIRLFDLVSDPPGGRSDGPADRRITRTREVERNR